MSDTQQSSLDQPGPNDPPPQEEPTHDVPVYPEQDPPPSQESAIQAAGKGRKASPTGREDEGEPRGDPVEPEDVDEDDLDPRKPHHPPDASKDNILFDENNVPS